MAALKMLKKQSKESAMKNKRLSHKYLYISHLVVFGCSKFSSGIREGNVLYRDSDGGLTDRTKQISFPARITK
jgi:hypothetical protein